MKEWLASQPYIDEIAHDDLTSQLPRTERKQSIAAASRADSEEGADRNEEARASFSGGSLPASEGQNPTRHSRGPDTTRTATAAPGSSRRASLSGTEVNDSMALGLADACLVAMGSLRAQLLHGTCFRIQRVSHKQRAKLPPSVSYTSPSAFAASAASRRDGNPDANPEAVAVAIANELSGSESLLELGVVRVEAVRGHLNFHVGEDMLERAVTKRPKMNEIRDQQQLQSQDGLDLQHDTETGQEDLNEVQQENREDELTCAREVARGAAIGTEFSLKTTQGHGGREGSGLLGGPELAMRFFGIDRWQGLELVVEIVPANFYEEEFQLYRKYQTAQHGDKPQVSAHDARAWP